MNTLKDLLGNLVLSTTLLVLILGPIGTVAVIGGLDFNHAQELGGILGATEETFQGTFSVQNQGELKKLSVTTHWGKEALYRNALLVRNKSTEEKTYRLEIIAKKGMDVEKQSIDVYFERTDGKRITVQPNETAGITLEVAAPYQKPSLTQTAITLAVWEE
ncbi:MAG: hypothetical protein ACOC6Q_02275 [Patescibacteria group bacterium]